MDDIKWPPRFFLLSMEASFIRPLLFHTSENLIPLDATIAAALLSLVMEASFIRPMLLCIMAQGRRPIAAEIVLAGDGGVLDRPRFFRPMMVKPVSEMRPPRTTIKSPPTSETPERPNRSARPRASSSRRASCTSARSRRRAHTARRGRGCPRQRGAARKSPCCQSSPTRGTSQANGRQQTHNAFKGPPRRVRVERDIFRR